VSRVAPGPPWRRLAAWGVDWLVISAYAAALVPLGLLLVEHSVRLPPLGWNAVSFLLLVLPATVWAAAWERSRRGATPGKRLLKLRVRTLSGGRPGWGPALARNTIKIAVPWEAGHTAAFLLADPGASGAASAIGMASALVACTVAAVHVATLFIGTGRTGYDRATGTEVLSVDGSTVSSRESSPGRRG
jgi:uncharacterized RDD family membrane protein YckC